MARAKDLAALAGLAGLAYAMRKKDSDTSTTDTGDETDRLKARSPAPEQSAGDKAVADTNSSVLTAIQNPNPPREAGIAAANDVRASATPASTPVVKPTAKSTSKTPQMTAAQNNALAKAGQMRKPNPRLDQGGRSASLDAINAKIAARDEDARIGNIRAANRDIRGRNMETEILNNMITNPPMKKGGVVKKMAKGGMTSTASSASKRADGIASKGKTKCKMY